MQSMARIAGFAWRVAIAPRNPSLVADPPFRMLTVPYCQPRRVFARNTPLFSRNPYRKPRLARPWGFMLDNTPSARWSIEVAIAVPPRLAVLVSLTESYPRPAGGRDKEIGRVA